MMTVPSFDWQAENLPAELAEFKLHAELAFAGPLISTKEGEHKAYVLLWLGRMGRDVFKAWDAEASNKTLSALWIYLERHCQPHSNFWLSRINLSRLRQESDEPIDKYIIRLTLQSQRCDFRDKDEMKQRMTEQLIIGVRHQSVQDWMLTQEKMMGLETAVQYIRNYEAKQTDIAIFRHEEKTIDVVNNKYKNNNKYNRNKPTSNNNQTTCNNCTKRHEKGRRFCPSRESRCNRCHREGHWAVKFKQKQETHNNIHEVRDIESIDKICFDTVYTRSEAYAKLDFMHNGTPTNLRVKVDTGAQGNLLPMRTFIKMSQSN